jgi:hypothetical protein
MDGVEAVGEMELLRNDDHIMTKSVMIVALSSRILKSVALKNEIFILTRK